MEADFSIAGANMGKLRQRVCGKKREAFRGVVWPTDYAGGGELAYVSGRGS